MRDGHHDSLEPLEGFPERLRGLESRLSIGSSVSSRLFPSSSRHRISSRTSWGAGEHLLRDAQLADDLLGVVWPCLFTCLQLPLLRAGRTLKERAHIRGSATGPSQARGLKLAYRKKVTLVSHSLMSSYGDN